MTTKFKKNDPVYYITSWDDKGTFYITPARVYSCGMKRMVLDRENGSCLGRDFKPNDIAVFPRQQFQTKEMVEEMALTMATAWIAAKLEMLERNLLNPAYHHDSVRANIAAVKANGPKFIWKD